MSKQFYAEIFQTRLKEAIAPENLKQWCQRVGIPLSTITGAAQRKTVPGDSTLLELSKLTWRPTQTVAAVFLQLLHPIAQVSWSSTPVHT